MILFVVYGRCGCLGTCNGVSCSWVVRGDFGAMFVVYGVAVVC